MIAFIASVGLFSACHTFPQQQEGAGSTPALEDLRLSIDSRELTADRAVMEERLRAMIAAVQSQTSIARPLAEREVASTRRITLRSQPRTLSWSKVKALLARQGYFDRVWNERGKGVANDFVNNGNGTVTDRATGLMWQQGGSADFKSYDNLDEYVKQLNRKRFAGQDDWRLPTLEEAASLLEPQINDDLYIDPIFDQRQFFIWTADVAEGGEEESDGAIVQWVVYFNEGSVEPGGADGFVRVCRISGT